MTKTKTEMTPELRDRLAEYSRRKRGTLLKDCSPADILIACDYVEAELGLDVWGGKWFAYVKYAMVEQVDALRSRLPCWRMSIMVPRVRKLRVVALFPHAALSAVLGFLVREPDKYMAKEMRDIVACSNIHRSAMPDGTDLAETYWSGLPNRSPYLNFCHWCSCLLMDVDKATQPYCVACASDRLTRQEI